MLETSFIEINEQALQKNLHFIHSLISPSTLLSLVVKGNAYGHGIEQYVPIAERLGVRHFSVYSADEAQRVRSVTQEATRVMIMGAVDDDALDWAIKNGIECWVFEMGRLQSAVASAERHGRKARLHIEVETGMHRTGLERDQWQAAAEVFHQHEEHLEFTGLCTHFAGAENISNDERIREQMGVFEEARAFFRSSGLRPMHCHTCCSAAVLRYPNMVMDLVRIGILQYGFWPSPELFAAYLGAHDLTQDPLKRLITWRSYIMSIKDVAPGSFIGYGTTYLAQRHMRIALVPVGYGHGFSRSLSNHGRAIVGQCRVAVVGMVNMNCIALDISEVPHSQLGDPVILIGREQDLEISVASFAEASNQLNYELLTRLPHNIPRVVVDKPI